MPIPTAPAISKRSHFFHAVLRSLLLCSVALGPCGPAVAAGADAPLAVFATVVPVAGFVERIGGERVAVQPMVRPGQNPHTYDPSPRQVAALAGAALYVRVGMPLEDAWLPRIRATNPGLRILDAREGIRNRTDPEAPWPDAAAHPGGGHEGHEGHEGHDPEAEDVHVWTSPPLAKAMGARIRDALCELKPGETALFQANYARFAADLDALDAALRARLAPHKGRRFMVFHPAWGYFADTYGLVQVAVERQGKEPGARALAGLIAQAREEGVRVVLVQPQMSPRAAEQIAAAIGGRLESIDPLSADYFGTLRRLADLIAEGDGA